MTPFLILFESWEIRNKVLNCTSTHVYVSFRRKEREREIGRQGKTEREGQRSLCAELVKDITYDKGEQDTDRDREKEKDRDERARQIQRQSKADKQTDREKHKKAHTDRQAEADRETDRQTEIERGRLQYNISNAKSKDLGLYSTLI